MLKRSMRNFSWTQIVVSSLSGFRLSAIGVLKAGRLHFFFWFCRRSLLVVSRRALVFSSPAFLGHWMRRRLMVRRVVVPDGSQSGLGLDFTGARHRGLMFRGSPFSQSLRQWIFSSLAVASPFGALELTSKTGRMVACRFTGEQRARTGKTKAASNKLHHPRPAALVADLLTGDSNVIELPKAC